MRCYVPEGHLLETAENQRAIGDAVQLRLAKEREDILEAKAVRCDSEHNLHVALPCMDGIIPREEGAVGIEDGSVRDIALLSRVGKPVSFVVSEIVTDENGRSVARLSRRRAQELCRREYVESRLLGDVMTVRVTRLETFGAFCDIGCGLVALLPIASMSVSRISHPRDRVAVGDTLRCVLSSVKDGRICLSMRELLGTWEENASRFMQGETVMGRVRSIESYGVFIELAPNLAGLAEPRADVCVGQTVSVFIKSILPDKMKIKLVIIDAQESDTPATPLTYFMTGDHVDDWHYAPAAELSVFAG